MLKKIITGTAIDKRIEIVPDPNWLNNFKLFITAVNNDYSAIYTYVERYKEFTLEEFTEIYDKYKDIVTVP